VHFPLELSANYPLRSNIALRFRWRQITWTCILFIIFFENHMINYWNINFMAFFAIYFWPSSAFHEIQILILEFSFFFCHKHLHIYSILLRNMRLSNFTSLSVLSFADKPKLAYLTRPTKKGENAQIVCKNQHKLKYDIWKQNEP
jgi:hypothetical protein